MTISIEMSQTFEIASFTVHEGQEQDLLSERPAVLAALIRAFPGLESAWLTRREDGSWADVILWRSREEARGIEHLDVLAT